MNLVHMIIYLMAVLLQQFMTTIELDGAVLLIVMGCTILLIQLFVIFFLNIQICLA